MKHPLAVRYLPIASVKAAKRNARTHSTAQVEQLQRSIREFGWSNPILVDEGQVIIAGHGRLEAARKLKLAEVPTITLAGLTDNQKRALALADNKLALNAGWDDEALRLELEELKGAFDVSLIGFSDDELAALLADKTIGLTDPDDAPDVADPISVLGDVWVLGRHRIVCGDSTDALVVERALNGVRPHLMVTDPPYGVSYDPTHRRALQSVNSNPAQGVVSNDDRADWSEAWSLFPGDVIYVWHAGNKAHIVAESLISNGFDIRAQIMWAKSKFVIGRGHYHPHHEPCWYAVRKAATGHWNGDRKQSTLWSIEHRKSETGHSTQKPVECMRRPIENNSSPGQAVYEPFSGSGTTIIAAEMTGRSCHAIELSPQYVDVAVRRWQAFTGQTATLEGDGRTFDDIATNRSESLAA